MYFVSSAERRIFARERFFVRCLPEVIRVGVVLRAESGFSAHLKFYCTSAGKSTFRAQNDTGKANFRCTVDKKIISEGNNSRFYCSDIYTVLSRECEFPYFAYI